MRKDERRASNSPCIPPPADEGEAAKGPSVARLTSVAGERATCTAAKDCQCTVGAAVGSDRRSALEREFAALYTSANCLSIVSAIRAWSARLGWRSKVP